MATVIRVAASIRSGALRKTAETCSREKVINAIARQVREILEIQDKPAQIYAMAELREAHPRETLEALIQEWITRMTGFGRPPHEFE